MSRSALTKSDISACALALCSILGLTPAWAADFPTGTYEAKEAPYAVSFDDKGQFHVNKGATLEVTGNYSIEAGKLHLTDGKGPWACTKAGEQAGIYAWKYENAVLRLSKVADKCQDRVKSLVNLDWKRQK
ncbi:MAG TPA: hypothetical protein VGL55_00820 [Steroidobacteraceae bacterium]|jgi:hypothetical protein